jgi:hypothetical protein
VHLDDTAGQKTFVLKCFFLDTFRKSAGLCSVCIAAPPNNKKLLRDHNYASVECPLPQCRNSTDLDRRTL